MKKNIIKIIKQYKKSIIFCSIFLLLEMTMDLLSPYLLSKIINIGIKNNNINYIIINIIIMLMILIIGIIGSFLSTFIASKTSIDIGYKLRKKLLNKTLNLENKEIDKLDIGKTITLITNDISGIENIIFLLLKIIIKIPLILIGSILMCLTINYRMSLILLFVVPIILILCIIIMKKSYPYFSLTTESLDEINSRVRENVECIKLVKSYNNEKYEMNKFDKLNKKYKEIDTKALKTLTILMPSVTLIINITTVIILLISKQNINNINIGDITAFIEYINILLSVIVSSSMIFLLIIQSSVSIKRINELLNMEEEKINKGIKKIKGKIEFKNVSFRYEEKESILENINLNINNGEKVLVIGKTGSGKTSLINLLNRNYKLSNGSILIDDIEIEKYDYNYLKERVRIIDQKSVLFKDTIENNIKFNKKINIEKTIKLTLSDKIINKKDKKNKFVIEQKGKNLSGGERQRIILSRALIKPFDILVLDDSLSKLDLRTEKQVINNILNEYKDKTIIFITNRIKPLRNIDKIVLLEDGKIKKIGTHRQLLKDPTYTLLYNVEEVLR